MRFVSLKIDLKKVFVKDGCWYTFIWFGLGCFPMEKKKLVCWGDNSAKLDNSDDKSVFSKVQGRKKKNTKQQSILKKKLVVMKIPELNCNLTTQKWQNKYLSSKGQQ